MVIDLNNVLNGLISSLDTAGERISEQEDRSVELSKLNTRRKINVSGEWDR